MAAKDSDTAAMPPTPPHAVQTHAPRPRGRPKSEDLQELEARLVSVARQAFIAHGYGATSMAFIARAARVSKNTLYARFASKAELFRAIIDDQINRTGMAIRQDVRRSLQAGGADLLRPCAAAVFIATSCCYRARQAAWPRGFELSTVKD